MNKEQLNKQKEKLKLRIPQESLTDEQYDIMLTTLLEDSFNIAINQLFPYEKQKITYLPENYENWQLRVCSYIKKNANFLGLTKYSENGIDIEFSSDNIPKSYMDELIPWVGVID